MSFLVGFALKEFHKLLYFLSYTQIVSIFWCVVIYPFFQQHLLILHCTVVLRLSCFCLTTLISIWFDDIANYFMCI